MRPVDVREGRPDGDAQEADDAEYAPEREAREDFAAHHAPPVAQAHLAECHRADHQRRRLRAGVAARRDDQRDEEGEDDGARDLVLEEAHRRGRQHLAQEEDDEPAGPLPDHAGEGDLHVRLVEGLRAADLLYVFGRLGLGHFEHVVNRHDADEHAVGVRDGQREESRPAEEVDGRLVVVRGLERVEAVVHQLRDERAHGREQEAAHPYVVDEQAAVVHDVDHVQRLAVPPVLADVVEHLPHGPVRAHGDVVRRHQATDAALGVAEQLDGAGALLRLEQGEHLLGDRARQFFEEGGAVVVGHRVEDGRHLVVPHGLEEFLLLVARQVLEGLRGQLARQDAEQKRLVVGVNPADEVGDLRRREPPERLAQPREVPRAHGGL